MVHHFSWSTDAGQVVHGVTGRLYRRALPHRVAAGRLAGCPDDGGADTRALWREFFVFEHLDTGAKVVLTLKYYSIPTEFEGTLKWGVQSRGARAPLAIERCLSMLIMHIEVNFLLRGLKN
jgi:hypothetical protein